MSRPRRPGATKTEVRVAGVDGCRGGWIVAVGPAGGGGPVEVAVVAGADEFLAVGAAVVAVDMPIGLPEQGARRACDAEARRRLGPRRSSVFPAPNRAALVASSFAEVRGLSLQAWNLVPKVRELDHLLAPGDQERVIEAHPELALCLLAGEPMAQSKRHPDGRAARRRLLAEAFGPLPAVPRGAAEHDLLDAVALLHTADRHHRGAAHFLGDGATDARGLRMVIVA